MTIETIVWLLILLPAVTGLVLLAARRSVGRLGEGLTLLATLVNLGLAVSAFGKTCIWSVPWAGLGLQFSLRLYHFNGFILLAAAGFAAAVALYSWRFMAERPFKNLFYGLLLLTLALANGAVLADHLLVLLFFWEGLLLTLFGMIAVGSKEAFKTATKAFIIVGITDLCMMFGIALTGWRAGTLVISQIHLPLDPIGGMAMILLTIGAISKAGSMPFHSWIPNAATDAPLPFMALLPASLEKLLGIYFLTRISLDLFDLRPDSWMSPVLMTVGAITIILAVMMALVQKDYKRLLSYHAISQVGYMILGIGTAVPAGIVGGLFHMINNALYKSGLFLTAGAVEKQAGTTDLARLGGLGRCMPVTFTCFLIMAASISGVPPFNGFFSKELLYDATMERGMVFYLAALLGSFFTAASFLKLGHAAYLGQRRPQNDRVKEAPASMLVPMIVMAGTCVLFGLWNALPLQGLIQPVLGEQRLEGHDFAGLPDSITLVAMTVVVLGLALLNHLLGVRASGSGLGAVDHIHHAPGLAGIYDKAGKGAFDPYNWVVSIARWLSRIAWRLDRLVDWICDRVVPGICGELSQGIREAHNGDHARYIVWSIAGVAVVLWLLAKGN
jgi:formate hydrogenlyase subunit 3/multisubunit Na+/H+ antiporter MnhD subunit